MYKSPITIIESTIDSFSKSIIKQRDDAIFAEIQSSFGVDLDRGELIRALQHDRGQYDKGYADGNADATPRWILVTERLPEDEKRIVATDAKDGYCDVLFFNGHYWEDSYGCLQDLYEFTHWMPLPEPPKGE